MIDLHIHSNYSDGLDNIEKILRKANDIGLNTISITDHDTCKAYDELENIDYQKLFNGKIMKGIEISSKYKGHKIELLAYNFDNHHLVNRVIKKDNYRTNKKMREIIGLERIKLIKKMESLGLKVDSIYTKNIFDSSFESKIYNSILDNNNIDLVKEKLQDNFQESGYQFYRKCVTSPETPFYIDYSVLNKSIDEVCDIIHSIDGLVFLAHPFLYGMKDIMEELKEMYTKYPLDGIECYYNGFDKKQINNIEKFAQDNNLLVSGGSDYHAKPGYKNQLGYCMQGQSIINDNIIDNWNIEIKPIKRLKKIK